MAEIAGFYKSFRNAHPFDADALASMLAQASEARVDELAAALGDYLAKNLPDAIRKKSVLADYRTSPYVLMTTASTMHLEQDRDLAAFLINLKLYMGLETSFGKSIESVVLEHYPIDAPKATPARWHEHIAKRREFEALAGLGREERANRRVSSVWREIDKTCVTEDSATGRRWAHLMSVKSGPATINDTQVAAMTSAIGDHHMEWLEASARDYGVSGVDVVVGLTYGTEVSTNNKENQILAKLIGNGFKEADRRSQPGVLVNDGGNVRVHRKVGTAFWSYVGRPSRGLDQPYVFLEVLLALAKALKHGNGRATIEDALNERLERLSAAIKELRFPAGSLPKWVSTTFSLTELAWLAAAMGSFFDAPSGAIAATEAVIEGLADE